MFSKVFIGMLGDACLSIGLFMTMMWLLSIFLKRACIIDTIWGFGFVWCATLTFLMRWHQGNTITLLHLQCLICTVLWGSRLTYHLSRRFLSKSQEDFRYAKMRLHRPHTFVIRSLFTIFYLQMIIMLIIASPIFIIMSEHHEYQWVHVITLVLWCFGFYVEWQADRTLTQAKQQGIALVTHGVWSWSRHPNYMGDACVWWSLALMTYQSSLLWLALLSALLMNFLLRKVSGVPLLEKHMASKEGWGEYCQETPIFWPSIKNIWKSFMSKS